MIPFRTDLRPGIPLYEQVVYAAKKAIVSGQLRLGTAFPSVRSLSRELKINPNTAHKVIAQLIAEGLLDTLPGIGTVVASLPESSRLQRATLLGPEIEHLVVEAKTLGIPLPEVLDSVEKHWTKLQEGRKRR